MSFKFYYSIESTVFFPQTFNQFLMNSKSNHKWYQKRVDFDTSNATKKIENLQSCDAIKRQILKWGVRKNTLFISQKRL